MSDLIELFTIGEAAQLLNVPDGWLRKRVTAGTVPHSRLGKHVRFTHEHLREIIALGEEHRQIPTASNGVSPRARRVHTRTPCA